MAIDSWQFKRLAVASLHLDQRNPRLGRTTVTQSPRDLIQHLFEHDKAMDVAESIAVRGYFPNEPLLAIRENGSYVVVEGNRRLAALKALREPGLLESGLERQMVRIRRKANLTDIAKVPVIVVPDRRATDQLVAGRHVGTPVLPWQAENRATFILEKLDEGYEPADLAAELNFSASDIQEARQIKAIADMARALDLDEDVQTKLDSPRSGVFSTIERVLVSTVGREFFKTEPDAQHGFRGTTTKEAFSVGFKKLVTDVVRGTVTSRTLNTTDEIRNYLNSWDPTELPSKKRGSFVPSDLIEQPSPSTQPQEEPNPRNKPQAQQSKTVLPRDFKIRTKNPRLIDIHGELKRLERDKYPNAGAVLLRVFFELAAVDYLRRSGKLDDIIQRLGGKSRLQYDTPTMKQLVPELIQIAKDSLSRTEATQVEKAIRHDPAAPFTVSDLHAFVHQDAALPTARDILQFWLRIRPLFILMVEQDMGGAKE